MTAPTSLAEVISRLTVDGQDIKAKLARDAEEERCLRGISEANPPVNR